MIGSVISSKSMKHHNELNDENGTAKKTDVIVVLGARVLEDGRPSSSLWRRVHHAVELMRKGRSKVLLLTGGIGKHWPSEALVMKELSVSYGVAPDQIIMDETATSTMQNAAACAQIMRKNGWTTAIIVTDYYHLKRSLLAFKSFGISAIGSAPEQKDYDRIHWRRWYLYTRELLALIWYQVRTRVRNF